MKRFFAGVILAAFALSFAALQYARRRTREPVAAEDYAHLPRASTPPALWTAPPFSLPGHDGAQVSTESLAGQPYIANFIFTTCRTVCPLLTAKMVRLQRELKDLPLRFVSFSVDPEHDSPPVLAAYAQQWNASEPRWHVLATTPASLAQLSAGFRITAARTDAGVDAVMHSAVFVLVDGRGVVRGVYDSDEAAHFVALKRDAVSLAQAAPLIRETVEFRSGEVLFHELSCPNCHQQADMAPSLGQLLGRKRTLDTGVIISADEAYVKESIVAPEAKRVAGYVLRMPSYAEAMTADELERLVRYVVELPEVPAAEADAQVVVDPVCHMKVRTSSPWAVKVDGGVSHSFCSAWCRARYEENPGAYEP